jgi:hypothetical protein
MRIARYLFASLLLTIASLAASAFAARATLLAQQPASLGDDVPVRAIEPGTVTLPPAQATASERQFAFIVYGDTRGPADGQIVQPQHRDVVDTMLRTIDERQASRFPVRFIIQSGDAASNGRFGAQWNVSFTPLIERLIQTGRVPYLFAVGNHDVGSSMNLDDPGRKLGLANAAAAMSKLWPKEGTPQRMSGYPTFTFAYGQCFFIVLDSNIAGDRAQFEWVSSQLRALNRDAYPLVAVVFHHPPVTSGPHGGAMTVEPQSETMRRLYMPLFRDHHVRLLLTGHDHLYDHYIERYQDATGRHRIDHLVTGGGGAPIYRYSGEPDFDRYRRTALPATIDIEHAARPGANEADNPHHFVVVEVDNGHLRLQIVSTVAAPFLPYGTDWTSLD